MIDSAQLTNILILAGYFIASFAALTAGIIMSKTTKRIGAGSLEGGFKIISWGVFLIALGILVDALNSYMQISGNIISTLLLLVKEAFFVVGTYIIVIGSRKTVDKLESLTQ